MLYIPVGESEKLYQEEKKNVSAHFVIDNSLLQS